MANRDPIRWLATFATQPTRVNIAKGIEIVTLVALSGLLSSMLPLDAPPLAGLPASFTTARILAVLMGLVVFWRIKKSA